VTVYLIFIVIIFKETTIKDRVEIEPSIIEVCYKVFGSMGLG